MESIKQYLLQKLTSRKFWLAVAGVIVGIVMINLGITSEGSTLIVTSITVGIGAEALVDAARLIANKVLTTASTTKTVTATSTDKTTVQAALASGDTKEDQ